MQKIKKHDLITAHRKARAACNDLICALEENPKAVRGLSYKSIPIEHKTKIAHIGIFGLIGAWFMKSGIWH